VKNQSLILLKAREEDGKPKYLALVKDLGLDGIGVAKKTVPPRAIRPAQNDVIYTTGGSADLLKVCKDGERTTHLLKLCGWWTWQAKPLAEVITLCKDWNASNTPPLDDEKIESTCSSIWDRHQRNHPATTHYDLLEPLFDLTSASITGKLSTPPPRMRWVLDGLLPQAIVGMLVAQGGTGKSMLALQLGIAVASGHDFLGAFGVPKPGGVLLLFAEDDDDEVHRRLDAAMNPLRAIDPALAAVVGMRLFIKSMVSHNNLMTEGQQHRSVASTGYADRLILSANQIPDLRLIVIDPASRFRGGDENTAQDTTRFVEELERIRMATGATILILHHTNKGSMSQDAPGQGASRGSSALTDGVRWQMNLNRLTAEAAKRWGFSEEQRKKYLVATVTKSNYGKPIDPILLRQGDHGVLTHIDGEPPAASNDLAKVVKVVLSEAAQGRHYSSTAFSEKIGGELGVLKLGKIRVRALIKKAILNGQLIIAAGGSHLLWRGPNAPGASPIADTQMMVDASLSSVKKARKSKA